MQEAVNYAEKYRYYKDIIGNLSTPDSYKLDFVENNLARNSLSINKEILPRVENVILKVCNKLSLDRTLVKGYIYSSNELQAYCYSTNREECIVQISSRLIELLDESELMFVVGHEVGHFLLGHGVVHTSENKVNMYTSRFQELSADRIGVLATNDEKASYRAIIKIASGLSSEHLRFDLNKFLKQINNVSLEIGENLKNTHPSLLIRSRAILWFNIFLKQEYSSDSKKELDKNIDLEIEKYLDGPLNLRIKELKKDLKFWSTMLQVLKDKKFDKTEQKMISNNFGDEILLKVKNLIKNSSIDDLNKHIENEILRVNVEIKSLE